MYNLDISLQLEPLVWSGQTADAKGRTTAVREGTTVHVYNDDSERYR
jgi:hypothetical protein